MALSFGATDILGTSVGLIQSDPHTEEKVTHWALQAADSHNSPGLKANLGKALTLQGG